jgi:Raf kinase inhibitor-like YbhB/YbcL family protein
MRPTALFVAFFAAIAVLDAQTPPPAAGAVQTPPQTPPAGQRGGGAGRGRGSVVMSLSTPSWTDGGMIPQKHTQAGDELSPALAWSGAPDTTASFALIVHDLDAASPDGTSDLLHWMVWNIPKTATGLPEGIGHGPERADGARQISASGPYYRGPAAPATGPAHHYAFELFALDTMLDVKPVGASVAETRAAVLAAMATHVRGKAVLVGLYKRP